MAHIDQFINQLAAQQADALFLESGNTVYLGKQDMTMALINVRPGELQNEHVRMWLAEIAAGPAQAALSRGEACVFDYQASVGTVHVEFVVFEGRFMARLTMLRPVVQQPAMQQPMQQPMMQQPMMQQPVVQQPAMQQPVMQQVLQTMQQPLAQPTMPQMQQPMMQQMPAAGVVNSALPTQPAVQSMTSMPNLSSMPNLPSLQTAPSAQTVSAANPAAPTGQPMGQATTNTASPASSTTSAAAASAESASSKSPDAAYTGSIPDGAVDISETTYKDKNGKYRLKISAEESEKYRKQLEKYFQYFIDKGASDLHLTSGKTPMMRLDGDMVPCKDLPNPGEMDVEWMIKCIMPQRSLIEFEESNDADYPYEIPGSRIRANAFRDRFGVGGVFRKIPTKILTSEQLNLPQSVMSLCTLKKGLVVVTGPTGSGKSTTLAAMVDWINRNRADHIITIEDPIEFVHEPRKALVNQRQIGQHTKSFSRALRAALREDPDIVLVGEMRDLETVAIAIETAETGHLVFGTLHTNTAPSTVDRIIDQFPTDRQEQVRLMLSESLKGVVAQILCKKKGGGRVAALEILICTTAITNLIREHKTFQIPSVMQTNRGLGMRTLNDSLLEHINKGVVEPAEAYGKAVDKMGLLNQFKNLGVNVSFLENADKH